MRAIGALCQMLTFLTCLVVFPFQLESQAIQAASKTEVKQDEPTVGRPKFSLGDLPLQFEENVGQTQGNARFLARGHGYTMFLDPDGVVLILSHGGNKTTQTLAMRLHGSDSAAQVAGQEEAATQTSYYIGNNPSLWHLNVRSYHSVSFTGIYKGIDVLYHGNGNQLEYDFVIAPGADPAQVRMRFDGLKPSLNGSDLSFDGESGFSLGGLKAFQIVHGEKKAVDASWQLQGDRASIQLGPYDHQKQLVIDPVFFYGSYIGGALTDNAVSIVPASQAGDYYVALSTSSAYLLEPTPTGSQNCTSTPPVNCTLNPNTTGSETLILELNAGTVSSPSPYSFSSGGSQLTSYPTLGSVVYIGGTSNSISLSTTPTAMIADSSFNLYVTGTTNDAAGLPSVNSQLCAHSCPSFVLNLNSALSPQYSVGVPVTSSMGIAVDTSGDTYLTGVAAAGSLTIPSTDTSFQSKVTSGTALTSGNHAFLTEIVLRRHRIVCLLYRW